jgi:hypothetical protein
MTEQLYRECGICGVTFQRPRQDGVPDGYCTRCWQACQRYLDSLDRLGDAHDCDCGAPEGTLHRADCPADAWAKGEERIDRIAQSDASGDHYAEDTVVRDFFAQEMVKQARYQDAKGGDWIDEFARTSTAEEFRGAMRFTVGKYLRRIGRKDAELSEVRKMRDYCQRWERYLLQREGE